MADILDGLNDSQREAVVTTEGPVLMLAGAGSGKTKALTHRIAYLVQEKKINPANILAVTFTNKAAGEMRHRLARLCGFHEDNASYFPFLGTFHSIANRILRREAESIGYSSNFLIYDMADSQSLVKQILKELQLDEKKITPGSVLHSISGAKNELITPEKFAELAHGVAQTQAAEIYPRYQAKLREADAMDFDDMIMNMVQLLRSDEAILQKYQQQFAYIMVDEYQDTNLAQYELIHLLARAHSNICVVGDDWQSIYSWRGANYQNILNFERDYPDAKVVKLEQNYRSTQTILDAAYAVIARNTDRTDKKLWTESGAGEKVAIVQVGNELDEGRFVVQTIEDAMRSDSRVSRHDFAVLYRTNAQSRALEESFLRFNMPYQIVGGVRFYDRKEIKDLLAYLRVVANPMDRVSLGRIINVPARSLGEKSVTTLLQAADQAERPILDTMLEATNVDGLTPRAAKAFTGFAQMVMELQEFAKVHSVSETLEQTIKQTDYRSYLEGDTPTAEDRLENVAELVGVARNYDATDVATFLSEITLLADVDSMKEGSDAVTMMTLHSAKGLEFDTVFMVGMEEGIFPHSRTFFEPTELEEERRLCYVGMTRAKSKLYMIHASSRLLYGTTQHNVPSRFLAELPAELVENNARANTLAGLLDTQPADEFSQEASYPTLMVGDEIEHPVFGRGTVQSGGEEEVVVRFHRVGVKTINLAYAPIKKL